MACFPWSPKASVSKLGPKCVNPFGASSKPWIGASSPCGQPDLANAASLTLIRSHPRSPVGVRATLLPSPPQTWSLDAPCLVPTV